MVDIALWPSCQNDTKQGASLDDDRGLLSSVSRHIHSPAASLPAQKPRRPTRHRRLSAVPPVIFGGSGSAVTAILTPDDELRVRHRGAAERLVARLIRDLIAPRFYREALAEYFRHYPHRRWKQCAMSVQLMQLFTKLMQVPYRIVYRMKPSM